MPVQADQLDRAVVLARVGAPERLHEDAASMTTPPATCAPWNPVMVKKHEANRLELGRKCPVALTPSG